MLVVVLGVSPLSFSHSFLFFFPRLFFTFHFSFLCLLVLFEYFLIVPDVINDPNLEQITFQYSVEFLKYGKLAEDATNDPVFTSEQEYASLLSLLALALSLVPFITAFASEFLQLFYSDPWKNEEVYLVQYAAVGSLGLLLRSNPGTPHPFSHLTPPPPPLLTATHTSLLSPPHLTALLMFV